MLNDIQRHVIDHHEGSILVHAGPGAGKTKTVIERCSSIIASGIPPYSILVVTFTREAASDIRKRIESQHSGGICMMTIHALGYLILRETHGKDCPRLIDEDEAEQRYIQACRRCGVFPTEDGYLNIVNNKARHLHTKNTIVDEYEDIMHKNNEMDMTDLISMSYNLLSVNKGLRTLWANRWSYITIDEAHDCTPMEAKLISMLAPKNLCVVFDENQSIYGWRGSTPGAIKTIRNFQNYQLPITYRCPGEIYEHAWSLIREHTGQSPLECQDHPGRIGISYGTIKEAIGRESAMVLCRTQQDVDMVEGELQMSGIPTNAKGGVYDSYEADVILGYARGDWSTILRNPFQEKTERHKRMLRRATYRKPLEIFLSNWRETHFQIDPTASDRYWKIMELCTGTTKEFIKRIEAKRTPRNNVRVMTMHASKGLEDNHVILYNMVDGISPHINEPDIDAERRLFYVGMTRAKKNLTVMTTRDKESRFIGEANLGGKKNDR